MATIFWNRNIPNEAHQAMKSMVGSGEDIVWVAYPPGGGNRYSVIAANGYVNRNVPDELHQKMGEFKAAGHRLLCVAFPPAGGNSWSLITDKGYFNRNIPDECHQKMGELVKGGHRLRSVAFPPQGGNSWSIITDKSFLNRNVPEECHQKMSEFLAAGSTPRCVAFPSAGGNRWSLLADNAVFNRNIVGECHTILTEMVQHHGPFRCVAFAPGANNWSAVSTRKPVQVYRLPFDFDLDWKLGNGNWDDPINAHGPGDPNGGQAYGFDFLHDANNDGAGEEGQNVRAMRGGRVVFADGSQTINTFGLAADDPRAKAPGGGNCVVIDHGDGTFGSYCHLQHNRVFVSVNDIVEQGHVLAFVGNTGHSTTPHTHVGVNKGWNPPNSVGPSLKVYFEARNHICWIPRVGESMQSTNS